MDWYLFNLDQACSCIVLNVLYCTFVGLEGTGFDGNGNGNTERFRFVDGSQEGLDFFEEPFVFPWAANQPNDFGSDDDCVR